MSKIRRMFPGGNTSEGFCSFHDNIIGFDRNMLYILKGMPGGGKSSLMKDIGHRALDKGFTVEFHHCPSDAGSIDGVVIKELKVGIVDGTAPHIIDPVYPGLMDRLVDLGEFVDSEKLSNFRDEIIEANLNNKKAYRKAFAYFKSARVIYDDIAEDNKSAMDLSKVGFESRELMDKVFSHGSVGKGFKIRDMFSSANTPGGYVDYTRSVLEGVSNIYYIKGDIGTGKNHIFHSIIENCKLREYSIEVYYDPTILSEVESIFIKDIDSFISSNKNAFDLSIESIDLDKYLDKDLVNIEDYNAYKFLVKKGIENLEKAKENHDILEEIYNPVIDFTGVDRIKESIWKEIKSYI